MNSIYKIRCRTTFLLVLISCLCFSQAPQRMSYQAVVRNVNGNLVTSANVGVRISILKGTSEGLAVYSETHSTGTNANGLVTLQIGGGDVVSGDFANIDWSDGPYFVKVETDPEGGTNYSISGVSQFLSVPYALYAAQTKFQGKSTIYLTGDITDAEAAARIASEAGPNTENIYILDTTLLTTVDFTGLGLKTLMNLKINGNAALQSVVFSELTQVYDTVEILGNNALSSMSYPQLSSLKTLNFLIEANPALLDMGFSALSTIQCNNFGVYVTAGLTTPFPNLTSFKGNIQLYAESNLALPQLQTADGLYLFVPSVTMPALVSGSVELNLQQSNAVSLNSFTNGKLSLQGLLTGISLPAFSSGELKIENCDFLTDLVFPALTNAKVRITLCDALSSVSLPVLTSFTGGGAFISQNPSLAAISFPNLTTIDNSVVAFPNVSLGYNSLDSNKINSFLHQFLTVGVVYGLDLRQEIPAPPSGQGIIDKQTLISQGKNVLTN